MSEKVGGELCATALLLQRVSGEQMPEAQAVVAGCVGCTALGHRLSPTGGEVVSCPSLEQGVDILAEDVTTHTEVTPLVRPGEIIPGGPIHTALQRVINDRRAEEAARAPGGKEAIRQQLVVQWELDSLPPRQKVWDEFVALLQGRPATYTSDNFGIQAVWHFERFATEDDLDVQFFTQVTGKVDYERMPADLRAAIKHVTPGPSGAYPKPSGEALKNGLLGVPSEGRWWWRDIPREPVLRRLDEVVPTVLWRLEGSVTSSFVGDGGPGDKLSEFAVSDPAKLVAESEVTSLREPHFTSLMERCRRGVWMRSDDGQDRIVASEPTEAALLALLRSDDRGSWGLGRGFSVLQDAQAVVAGSLPVDPRVR